MYDLPPPEAVNVIVAIRTEPPCELDSFPEIDAVVETGPFGEAAAIGESDEMRAYIVFDVKSRAGEAAVLSAHTPFSYCRTRTAVKFASVNPAGSVSLTRIMSENRADVGILRGEPMNDHPAGSGGSAAEVSRVADDVPVR